VLLRRVAAVAPRYRSVAGEVRRRVAMTTKTEIVEARFCADPDAGAAAAMATDTRVGAGPIGEVVMTLNAVHRAMLVMRKTEDQWLTATQEGFTQGQRRASSYQHEQRGEGAEDDYQDQPRMPSEDESTEETRGLLSGTSLCPRP